MSIVRLDRIDNFQVESVQVNDVLLNGYWLQLGGQVTGNRDLRLATKPTDVTKGGLVFHATPEVMADPRKQGLKDFQVEANAPARAYRLAVGSSMTLTADLFNAVPNVGDVVSPKAGSYLLHASAGTETVALQVMASTVLGFAQTQAFEVQVVKSEF